VSHSFDEPKFLGEIFNRASPIQYRGKHWLFSDQFNDGLASLSTLSPVFLWHSHVELIAITKRHYRKHAAGIPKAVIGLDIRPAIVTPSAHQAHAVRLRYALH
jgi:hypothetical protein